MWVDCVGQKWLMDCTHLSIRERVDHHAERRQTLVDLFGLLQSLARGARLADLFGTSQIDEVEVTRLLGSRVRVALVDTNDKDRVRTRRLGVHVGRRDGTRRTTGLHDLEHLGLGTDIDVRQALDVHAAGLVLVDRQVVVVRCGEGQLRRREGSWDSRASKSLIFSM